MTFVVFGVTVLATTIFCAVTGIGMPNGDVAIVLAILAAGEVISLRSKS